MDDIAEVHLANRARIGVEVDLDAEAFFDLEDDLDEVEESTCASSMVVCAVQAASGLFRYFRMIAKRPASTSSSP
ncbi:hypothetical protein ACFQWF_07875 [Methylorubrum suomiense]